MLFDNQSLHHRPADFGVIGLTEDSKNLLLHMDKCGYVGCVYDVNNENVKSFLENEAKGTGILGADSLKGMTKALKRDPKIIMLIVEDLPIDDFIDDDLLPYMSYNDYIIDAGSSGREVSKKRVKDLKYKGIQYIGSKDGPSAALLHGIHIGLERYGSKEEIQRQRNQEAKASEKKSKAESKAKETQEEEDTKYCCCWGKPNEKENCIKSIVGEMSSKDRKLFSEVEQFLSDILSLSFDQHENVLYEWSKEGLTSPSAYQSSYEKKFKSAPLDDNTKEWIGHLKTAVCAFKIIIYAKGYATIKEIDDLHQWNINYAEFNPSGSHTYIKQCKFFSIIKAAFTKNPQLPNLLLDEDFAKFVHESLPSIGRVIQKIEMSGKVFTIFSNAVEYYEHFTAKTLVCRKFLETLSEGKTPADLDLTPLVKYQHQLLMLQSSFEMIENTLKTAITMQTRKKKFNYSMKFNPINTRLQLDRISMKWASIYKSCIMHLDKDEKVYPLLVDIIKEKRSNIIEAIANAPLTPEERRYSGLRIQEK